MAQRVLTHSDSLGRHGLLQALTSAAPLRRPGFLSRRPTAAEEPVTLRGRNGATVTFSFLGVKACTCSRKKCAFPLRRKARSGPDLSVVEAGLVAPSLHPQSSNDRSEVLRGKQERGGRATPPYDVCFLAQNLFQGSSTRRETQPCLGQQGLPCGHQNARGQNRCDPPPHERNSSTGLGYIQDMH